MLKLHNGFGSSREGVLARDGSSSIFAYSFSPACSQFYLFYSRDGFEDNNHWIQVTGRSKEEYERIISRQYGRFSMEEMLLDAVPLNVVEFGPGMSPVLIELAQMKREAGQPMPLAVEPLQYESICDLAYGLNAMFPQSMVKLGDSSVTYDTLIRRAEMYMDPSLVERIHSGVEGARFPMSFVGQTDLVLDICATIYSGDAKSIKGKVAQLLTPDGLYIRT
jgi:hypothetical protein